MEGKEATGQKRASKESNYKKKGKIGRCDILVIIDLTMFMGYDLLSDVCALWIGLRSKNRCRIDVLK